MIQALPFKILDCVALEKFNLNNYCEDGLVDLSLDDGLHYPDKLHNLHNDLAAEK